MLQIATSNKASTMYMANESAIAVAERVENLILILRGQRVMIDADLAKIYGVTTKHLNQQFRRNQERFPDGFAFELVREEVAQMRSQFVTASRRNIRHRPIAFTEHGAIMLAMVLKSATATEASVRIVSAFVFLREQLKTNLELAKKFAELEKRLDTHDESLAALFEAIRRLLERPAAEEPKREIGFHLREQAPPYRVRVNRKR